MTAMPGPPGAARYFCGAPLQQAERTPGVKTKDK